jgi:adenine-specific DNA-methyltransferase
MSKKRKKDARQEAPVEAEKLDLRSHDLAAQKRADLLRLFPEARTEDGGVDFERLKLALGESVEAGRERYGMTWPGKADCFRAIQTPSLGTLRPCREESNEFDATENLIIEGDNLEVLKLLQKSYLGKVKMIYIDPPYNTGKDFIYPDDYSESLQTYLEYTGQVDAEGRKFSTNTDTDGRFHSKWLNMMYPRLYLARNLLREDGAIFISIDDGELEGLRRVCDEVFGETNFIATVIWQKVFSPKNSARHFSEDHDYIVVYARSADAWKPTLLPRSEQAKARYANPDNDPRGDWTSGDLTARNYYGEGSYSVTAPGGKTYRNSRGTYWRVSHAKFEELDADGRIWWGPDGNNMPRLKRFLSEVREGVVPQTLWKYEDVGHTQEAKRELLDLVSFAHTENVLDTVKPTRLIRRMLQIATDAEAADGDIVLDFFAGSGSTAHAVLDQNHADGGKRRFILVQLPEPLPTPESGLATIADIVKARTRSVIEGLVAGRENALDLDDGREPDLGFRVLKLAESNFTTWDATMPHEVETLEEQLELHVEHVRERRSEEDILYELLLKSGYSLTVPLETIEIEGRTLYRVGGRDVEGELLICLARDISLELVRAIAKRKPERVICLDEGFAGNDQLKANAVQLFKTKGVTSFRTV